MKAFYKFFTIPIDSSDDIELELNRFIQSHKIIKVNKELITNRNEAYWCFLIEYLGKADTDDTTTKNKSKPKVDYKEILSPEDFTLYAKIRDWRKQSAENEGIMLYSILTNEQMAKIAENKITSIEKFKQIDGIGEQRLKKYANDIIKIVKEFTNEKSKKIIQSNTNA
jgi:superfamily II DNA helicase RecQ